MNTAKVLKVIIIEDNPGDLKSIVGVLETMTDTFKFGGHASTGEAGIVLALEERPDLVLLDLGLPDMSGFKVWDWLHQLNPTPDTIPITGDNSGESIRKAHAMGALSYIYKPFSRVQLRNLLQEYHKWDGVVRRSGTAGQAEINYGFKSQGDMAGGLPKGLSRRTQQSIQELLQKSPDRWFNAHEVGQLMKMSRSCASRYLNNMTEVGYVTSKNDYLNHPGRPAVIYRWADGTR
jgi:two-component system CitB family response regulator